LKKRISSLPEVLNGPFRSTYKTTSKTRLQTLTIQKNLLKYVLRCTTRIADNFSLTVTYEERTLFEEVPLVKLRHPLLLLVELGKLLRREYKLNTYRLGIPSQRMCSRPQNKLLCLPPPPQELHQQ
jgi:hypothetical protein